MTVTLTRRKFYACLACAFFAGCVLIIAVVCVIAATVP